ncbi:MAG: hypothetical protein K2P86_06690 [Xanthobacteraceae bacterium]|nr:hypothetical protein [Xanthobacteraceae bacterium]
MYRFPFATALDIFFLVVAPQDAFAQRGGEVTVTITPGPEIKAELPYYVAFGEHRLHFNNTTSRHAKIISIELLFADQIERGTNCDNFFGNTIGAAVREYDLKNLDVPAGKTVTATAKLLPFAGHPDNGRLEPAFHDARTQRYTFIACYKFKFENDERELEVYQLAGRWTFDRKTGKLLQKNIAPKAELLPR